MCSVAFKVVAYLWITYGEYADQCNCCTTFRKSPEGVLPKALYDYKVRVLVFDRILKDRMSIERVLASLRRELPLDLSTGFVYVVLRGRTEQRDMAEHCRNVLEHMSRTFCGDELHLGCFTLLLATIEIGRTPRNAPQARQESRRVA
jgi:hypothetical protein